MKHWSKPNLVSATMDKLRKKWCKTLGGFQEPPKERPGVL